MIWGWWLLFIPQLPWVTSANFYFWPQPPWMIGADPRLLGIIIVWKGMTDSSRIISIDGTRRIVHLLLPALMSDEKFHYMRLWFRCVAETQTPLVNITNGRRGYSRAIWAFITIVTPIYMTPKPRASFFAGWELFFHHSTVTCEKIHKKKDSAKKGEKSPNWGSVAVWQASRCWIAALYREDENF